MRRWLLAALIVTAGVAALAAPAAAGAAGTGAGAVSRETAIEQLRTTSESIDRTLALMKAGRRQEAFAIAKAGYLKHFELVEIPLRAANPASPSSAEEDFAEIRALIRTGAPTSEVR